MTRWSKAPRGLFVLSQVARIFTGTSISPGPRLRQRSTRYSIRAGRNLPDKEFRYLRTIIVIAAVHQGFGSSRLKALPLTDWHRAGVSPHTSAYALAETCVFGKQSVEPVHCDQRPLTTRSGSPALVPLLPKLRGQFAEFLSLGSPVHLAALAAVYQCRFAVRTRWGCLEAFLAGTASRHLALSCPSASPSPLTSSDAGFATRRRLQA
jgi:hypothetical protein